MSKKFLIGGTIVADDAQKWAYEDVTPSQVRAVLGKLEDGEDITFDITSPGGDVTAGIAIANMIRQASKEKHPCKAHVIGIAASMASVITCACDEVDIDESAFMMIHNPWTVTQGDADDLRKSAEVLDKMRDAIISFYRGKFDKTDDELKALMDDETWFTGAEAEAFGFKANVIKNDEPLKAAACARSLPGFAKMPENAAGLFVIGSHEEKTMDNEKVDTPAVEPKAEQEQQEVTVEVEKPVEAPVEERPAEAPAEPVEDKPAEEIPADTNPVEEPKADEPMVTAADCEKRVHGMQASMQKQINDLQRKAVDEMAALEKKFTDQLEAKDKELISARAEITSLTAALDHAKGELAEASSALEAKTSALAQLNANVNSPADVKIEVMDARRKLAMLPPSERRAFYEAHKAEIDGKNN